MAPPTPPIIVLGKADNKVSAFGTTVEALGHIAGHGFQPSDLDFFDSTGFQLEMVATDDLLDDLEAVSDVDHSEQVRERVRARASVVRERLESQRQSVVDVPALPLDLPDADIPFARFAFLLELALRPTGSPLDPPINAGSQTHSAGWWHNLFGH